MNSADQYTEIIDSLKEIINAKQDKIDYLEEKVRVLERAIFSRSSEKLPVADPEYPSLFDEPEQAQPEQAHPETEAAEPEPPQPEPPQPEPPFKPGGNGRGKSGRKPIPAHLPRLDVVHDIDESEKICACGAHMARIGEEVCEKLDYVPAHLNVHRHVRPKYACKNCAGVESGVAVKIAPVPPSIVPRGMAEPGLVAHVAVSKFVDSVPLYRQEAVFGRIGIELGRGTMANWMIMAGNACKPLIELLRRDIHAGPVINIDETTVQVMNENDRPDTAKSWMWVFVGGPEGKPSRMFQYQPTRSGDVPRAFLEGYKGCIQTDGYSGYDVSGMEGISHIGCWAHARRKFVEAAAASSGGPAASAHVALGFIRKLYEIESRADDAGLSHEQRRELRLADARPALDSFKAWLDKRQANTPPKGLNGKAITYAINQWDKLVGYLADGRMRPDNNAAENAIRPFVVGRKNWLFSGHPRGAEASANLYSIIETAKANGHEPYRYLTFLFERLPLASSVADYEALLPSAINPEAIREPS